MPNLPQIPGKRLASGTTRRLLVLAAGAGAGVLAAGGFVVKRVLGHDGGDESAADADPIAETPTAPPGAERKPVPEPDVAKPKPKPTKAKAVKPKPPKAKPANAKAEPKPRPKPKAASKPPKTTGTDAPPKPEFEPGNIAGDKEPHHALNNPVADPDETEYPDPYEKRDDPRDPVDPDGAPFGEEPHPATGAESTSEPHPGQDLEAGDRAEPPRRENLDQ
jgi:hypothetical protein